MIKGVTGVSYDELKFKEGKLLLAGPKSASFSHSSLKMFETCARQYHEIRVLKKWPREENEQSIYGNNMHEAIEDYINRNKPLPSEFEFAKPTVDAVLSKRGMRKAEYEMAVTRDLVPCSWLSSEAWVRGIADVLIVERGTGIAWCADWKTGNDKYADKDQLDLMALLIFAHCPEVTQVNGALIFILKNSVVKHKVMRQDAAKLWWQYRERVARIDAAIENGVWNPNQSGLCKKYCSVASCEYNGRH